MKIIDIPLYLQDMESKDCGPVCVRMVLAHFGIEKGLEELASELTYSEMGTSAYDNGALLMKNGMQVSAVTRHPMLFPPDLIEDLGSKDRLLERVRASMETHPRQKGTLETLVRYLEADGQMRLQIPAFEHVKEAVDQGSVVIALVYARALGSKEGGFHFVVVNGYDEERVHVVNPLPESKREAWFLSEDFFYALHTSTTVDMDNGTLLIVSA